MTATVTTQDIIAAIEASVVEPSRDGFTTGEVCKARGVSEPTARKLVRQLIAAGRAEPCRVIRRYMDGRDGAVPGYRLIAKSRKK
jgi:hypothetical protein